MADVSQFTLWVATLLVACAALAHLGVFLARKPDRTPAPEPALVGGNSTIVPDHSAAAPASATGGRGLRFYGTWLSRLALIFLTISLIARAIASGHGPFTNQHEFAVSFGWGILAAYAWFEWRHRIQSLALLVMPIALAMLAYSLTTDTSISPLVPALQNHMLLTLHVFAAVLAYGAAAVGAAAAILYLLRPSIRWKGMPSADLLDEIGYRATVFSYPFLTLMLILGAIWADIAWGRYWSWDPKETAALVTWLIYGAYLHARVSRGWRGTRSAWLLVLGFVAILFTFFGNLFLGGLHSYA